MRTLPRTWCALLVAGLLLAGCAGTAQPRPTPAPTAAPEPVVVTHWANGWMAAPELLPKFAEDFNRTGRRTRSGRPIVVRPFLINSGAATQALIGRVARGLPFDPKLGEPTIVTPASDEWLTDVNYATGSPVFDLSRMQSMAVTWGGIVMDRGMAECLGWPKREIGYADILALEIDPRGWASCPTAKAEWGARPRISFTDPNSSTTARSVLFVLYSLASGKPPDQLTPADVTNPAVVESIKRFQRGVDHYVPDTLVLNSKIYLGPSYGHIYFVAEANLIQLYQGKVSVTVGGEVKPQRLAQQLVFIYPKEGAIVKNNPVGVVQASWVTAEQWEAAGQWIGFLREDAQQRAVMQEGFRPATRLPYADPIGTRSGIDPNKPTTVFSSINPAAAAPIIASWEDVKKPGVMTFVVDVASSMQGAKLGQAQKGVIAALDNTSYRNFAGLVTFADKIEGRVSIAPIPEGRFRITEELLRVRSGGSAALYEAIREAVVATDEAPGDPEAIRGVVVLTDGRTSEGTVQLHDLIRMMSRDKVPIQRCSGFERDPDCLDRDGRLVKKSDVIGTGLAFATRHPVHIFFVGVGADVDFEVGRLLAEATGASFEGTAEKDLTGVIEKFGKYF